MKNTMENVDVLDDSIDIDDYPIGLPNGVPKPPMEYNLGLMNRYMRENDKLFDELTPEEKNMFKHKHPHPL